MIKLLPAERASVVQYIYSVCAIALDESKDYLIEGRLSSLLQDTGCHSYSEFLKRVKSDASGSLKHRVIDAITTNETLFFRDAAPFDLLRHKLVPELIDRRSRNGAKPTIRIWSAACSTGQEIYSIAIVLKELLGNLQAYNIRLVGTDISDQAISQASRGVFNQIEMGRGLTDTVRTKFFDAHPKGWKIRDEIRAMASFRKLNLMEDFSSLGKLDIILCRNVAIYFNEQDRSSLFNRLEQRLEPDGCLLVGSMESLNGVSRRLEAKRHLRSVYYQPVAPAAA